MSTFPSLKDFLLTLLLKVCWAAALAALLVRFKSFRKLLFTENRDSDQKVMLLLFLTPPLALGVILRIVGGYRFFDLMLEGSFLMGLIGGRMVGLLGGSMISLPAFGMHEWLSSPVAALVGLLAGVIRDAMPEKEDIWRFGPFLFLNIPQWLWKLVRYGQGNWAMLPLFGCAAFESGASCWSPRSAHIPGGFWRSTRRIPACLLLVVFTSVICVGHGRSRSGTTRASEMNLEQNQQLLLKARMDALTSQINPHFLFNTLNTVSSLIRFDPDLARGVVLQAVQYFAAPASQARDVRAAARGAGLHRRLSDIEVIRFGRDKLQIFKEIDDEALDAFVPSMLLQPMVENAIKHGLAPRLEGGQIHSAAAADGRLAIEIEDNGIGISPERLGEVYGGGIGISNVHERLRLLYGDQFKMDIRSQEGQGTLIHIEVPELAAVESEAS